MDPKALLTDKYRNRVPYVGNIINNNSKYKYNSDKAKKVNAFERSMSSNSMSSNSMSNLSGDDNSDTKLDQIDIDIDQNQMKINTVHNIHFGSGSPSLMNVDGLIRRLFTDVNGNANEAKIGQVMSGFCKKEVNSLDKITFLKLSAFKDLGLNVDEMNRIINGVYDFYVPNGNLNSLNKNQHKIHDILNESLKSVSNNGEKAIKLKRYFVAFMNECDKCNKDCLNMLTSIGNDCFNALLENTIGIDNLNQRLIVMSKLHQFFSLGAKSTNVAQPDIDDIVGKLGY